MNVKCAEIIWLEAKLRECCSIGWDFHGQRDLLVYKINKLMGCVHPKYGRVTETYLKGKGTCPENWGWMLDGLSNYEREQREIDFEMNAMSYDCGQSVSLDSIL